MKLSEQTMAIIKNFSRINPNIFISPGSRISTINTSKSLMCNAVIEEEFPVQFGIYDLGQFINVIENFDDPELEFNDDHVEVSDSNGAKIKYYYSDPSLLVYSKKSVAFPGSNIRFRISSNDFRRLKKASSTLMTKELLITGECKQLVLLDSTNATKHRFSLDIEVEKDDDVLPDSKFYWSMDLINKLMVVEGDYYFEVSNKKLSRITDDKGIMEYFIALMSISES